MKSDLVTRRGGAGSRPRTEFRQHWPAVLACFATAVFASGFGFYGQSVYLVELQRLHGWPSSLISAATTVFFLAGALLLTRVHAVLERLGPRTTLLGGALLMGVGAVLFSRSQHLWQLYPAALVMALGGACSSATAITIVLAIWFDRQRGLAISLAFNGISTAGFTVAPALVALSSHFGLAHAVQGAVLVGLVILIPLILLGLRRGRPAIAAGHAPVAPVPDGRPAYDNARQALRDRHFWSVAVPFALVLFAQIGFLMHFVAFLMPHLGVRGTATAVSIVSGAAMLGRIGLGLVIDRLDQRLVSALSFASEVVALGLMLALPDRPGALYGGALLFGLSVGNVVTLPSLIVHREFAGRSFGLIIGLSTAIGQFAYALAPALLGVVRDLAGGYGPVLVLCMALELAGAVIVLRGRR
ncbi:MAG: MFS transporter [Alphaproteobacteria bacterium]|nr:MFS transporter [Alphaproteobacteria bacterium]